MIYLFCFDWLTAWDREDVESPEVPDFLLHCAGSVWSRAPADLL